MAIHYVSKKAREEYSPCISGMKALEKGSKLLEQGIKPEDISETLSEKYQDQGIEIYHIPFSRPEGTVDAVVFSEDKDATTFTAIKHGEKDGKVIIRLYAERSQETEHIGDYVRGERTTIGRIEAEF